MKIKKKHNFRLLVLYNLYTSKTIKKTKISKFTSIYSLIYKLFISENLQYWIKLIVFKNLPKMLTVKTTNF